MTRRAFLGTLATVLLVAALAGILYVTPTPALRGSVIDPPMPAAEISLTDTSGRSFQLSRMQGNVVLLYFGYTNCPDECPLTMATLKLAIDRLNPDEARRTAVVLVTTDPERDTPQALGAFVGRFDPRFLGLTGKSDELKRVWKDYGVTVLDGGETHSNYIYVIDPRGKLVETLLTDVGAEDIAADIQALLRAN